VPFSILNHQDRRILKLEGAVTIQHAQDLAAKLGERLEEGACIEVDTENLEDMDTCVLQVLCSLRQAVPAVSFADPSPAFIRALDRCGMRRELVGVKESL
jgi:anti-anti-sigma regulatory factor